jgi:hypothetical protein
MNRRLMIFLGPLVAVIALLAVAAPAFAALDPTTTAVSCSPSSVATGSATTCTASVTDTATTPSAPTGTVTFTPSPSTGDFGAAGNTCTLSGGGATASCHVTYTPASGGSYNVGGSYGGDTAHSGSSANGTVSAVDPTTTTLSCTPTTVQISTSTSCTAVLSDTHSKAPPIGEIDFSAAPATGSFGTPSSCVWQPSGSGGSATCQITFTPTNPGGYSLTAQYVGDDTHSASQGTSKVTATTTPENGGPGTHGGGSTTTVTIGTASGPPPPGNVTVARRAKVVHKHANVLLTCVGAAGSSCTGALTLTTKTKVKEKVKTFVKVKVRPHKKGKGKAKAKGPALIKIKPKIVTKRVTKTILVGTLSFGLATGSSKTVSVKVSKAAMRLLARHRGRLRTQGLVDGAVVHAVALGGKTHKHKKHKKHKKHHGHGHGGHAKKKH